MFTRFPVVVASAKIRFRTPYSNWKDVQRFLASCPVAWPNGAAFEVFTQRAVRLDSRIFVRWRSLSRGIDRDLPDAFFVEGRILAEAVLGQEALCRELSESPLFRTFVPAPEFGSGASFDPAFAVRIDLPRLRRKPHRPEHHQPPHFFAQQTVH